MKQVLPRILFISPTFPGGEKNGLSLRAGMWLKVLQKNYQVYLLVIPVADNFYADYDLKLAKLCEKICVASPSLVRRIAWKLESIFNGCSYVDKVLSDRYLHKVVQEFQHIDFDAIHIFRLYLSPAIKPFIKKMLRPVLTLDIDDIESQTNKRLSNLFEINGFSKTAEQKDKESTYYQGKEISELRSYDQVFVCSKLDAVYLEQRGLSNISIVPNVVPAPKLTKQKSNNRIFTFLFVGNFHYFPNQDAINWFVKDILPIIRKHARQRFRIKLVGSGSLSNLSELKKIQELTIDRNVPDIGIYYNNADVALAPIRAGGGTRIKIIEAFSFALPVVSTSIGIEGLNAVHNTHALLADTSEEFAMHCLKLMNSLELRNNIADNALELFNNFYLEDKVVTDTASLMLKHTKQEEL